jgi:hypothetical protein
LVVNPDERRRRRMQTSFFLPSSRKTFTRQVAVFLIYEIKQVFPGKSEADLKNNIFEKSIHL